MRQLGQKILSLITYIVLLGTALVSFMLPVQLPAAHAMMVVPGPSVIYLPGQLRDFRKAHPDFDVPLGPAYNHIAGNCELSLTASGRPGHGPGGFAVSSQWRNSSVNPIAPHLFTLDPTVKLVSAPTGLLGANVDSFNSFNGPYGGANVGPAPVFQTGAAMPTITVPAIWDQTLPGTTYTNVTVTFNSNTRFTGDTKFEQNSIVRIDGQISILIEGKMELDPNTGVSFQIVLLPGATLDLYVTGRIRIRDSGNLNMNTGDPRRVTIYALGPGDFEMREGTSLAANIIAPQRTLTIDAASHVYGRFTGQSINFETGGGYHHDGTGVSTCGIPVTDTAGVSGGANNAAITSAATFDQWFRDRLGTNLTTVYSLLMVRNAAGVYVLSESAFLPIDDMLFGNEGDLHNYNFTYSAEFSFVYNACTNQYFEFSGPDDFYLFIDGKLAIDLGGIMNGQRQVIELDRLALTNGQTYQGSMFFANRHAGSSSLKIETTVDIIPRMLLPVSSAGYD